MAYTYEELKKKPVSQLREIAEEQGDHEELHGHLTMHKHELLPALCKVLGIEAHEHHDVVGIDKSAIKAQIKALKTKRDAALEAKDYDALKEARHKIKRLKRKVRRATV
ncbi:MAG: hypothetical protein GWN99_02105 [Gemmatimonadetes bacterium]|uniref:Rho termination factor N-terminal domain-containing protein n=1 Tax=Candidatus Kutchimonas denitrificans TaxID=3056748 RepID=A0AAE4Z6G8_9BACT|nr:hypothetical protein [Gemmatimonadota bacterium]NIR74239.1 hypothetical protein [Candidatus Kutchimonas denitrificans]NIR99861.1 hypothetical protein [Gemmatimonadota bacterium]NIT65450.1 hypothetical protein [Gemmatimonadota bacterium]NIU51815.1 hypothetical protein [Gemmatimonadota bacterium]